MGGFENETKEISRSEEQDLPDIICVKCVNV
jgi:hypothetical protein